MKCVCCVVARRNVDVEVSWFQQSGQYHIDYRGPRDDELVPSHEGKGRYDGQVERFQTPPNAQAGTSLDHNVDSLARSRKDASVHERDCVDDTSLEVIWQATPTPRMV